ncbi:hypothetical protein [Staphylothermus hellenicus]|uniref:Uncharacterized protein n=1 Tax=Staphylothermus hellenicus (strain DSM 12710 / JCM 10830 / BK20S6-10-b1 / P8) TaxID=591019 RepID=D7DBC3_STAHD|nr:hypothetical protein [Staphylothermus hellenicus]ADI31470.1 hypothetical protein Shell_0338 [Staphylothermus hellenicus DSM 12710]
MDLRVYRNEDVEEIIAAIPVNHYHVRFLIKFRDQTILLQEATVAALLRAYAYTALHPFRKGIILRRKALGKKEKKPGYATHQLIEVADSEDEAVKIITDIIGEK